MKEGGGLRLRLKHLYYSSPIYSWRMSGVSPTRPLSLPDSHWPGDRENGRALLDGRLMLPGGSVELAPNSWGEPLDENLAPIVHGFEWLRDLKEFGGDTARSTARELLTGWLDRYEDWNADTWRADVTGRRVAAWLAHFEIFVEPADDGFKSRIMASLVKQAHHLMNDWKSAPPGLGRLETTRGLAFTALAFDGGGPRLEQSAEWAIREAQSQINGDGGHVTRSPQEQLGALICLIDIAKCLRAGDMDVPEALTNAMVSTASALRTMRHADGGFALFNGGTEGDRDLIDAALAQADGKSRAVPTLPDTLFERLAAGRSLAIVDTGVPSKVGGFAHAAPGSFEFSVGKQRLIVNCGSSVWDTRWRRILKATAAHSTLIIDDENSADLTGDDDRPTYTLVDRTDEEGASLISLEHDGYAPGFSVTHRRRIYLGADGSDLRGEDTLVYTGGPDPKDARVDIRFHLHPKVSASLTQNGAAALLRPQSGSGWRFIASDARLQLNDSVYFGDGTLKRSQQIVINSGLAGIRDDGEITVKWALRREDGKSQN